MLNNRKFLSFFRISSGLFLFGYMAHKGKFRKPKWWIEDPEGRQLAEGNDLSLDRHLKILAPDGGDIARVHSYRYRKTIKKFFIPSYRINILRQDFDPLLILSYTIIMVNRHKETVRLAAWRGW